MIKIIEGNLFDSKANFIVHQVNCQGIMGGGVALQVKERYPHVEREYRKYINYCNKNDLKILGSVQYVPSEVWAVGLVDTMKNNDVIDYDKNYQYIVNLFGQDTIGTGLQTDMKALKNGLIDIRDKAQKIGATVAMPYRMASVRGGANWENVYTVIKKVFENSDVDVEIWRYDLG